MTRRSRRFLDSENPQGPEVITDRITYDLENRQLESDDPRALLGYVIHRDPSTDSFQIRSKARCPLDVRFDGKGDICRPGSPFLDDGRSPDRQSSRRNLRSVEEHRVGAHNCPASNDNSVHDDRTISDQ